MRDVRLEGHLALRGIREILVGAFLIIAVGQPIMSLGKMKIVLVLAVAMLAAVGSAWSKEFEVASVERLPITSESISKGLMMELKGGVEGVVGEAKRKWNVSEAWRGNETSEANANARRDVQQCSCSHCFCDDRPCPHNIEAGNWYSLYYSEAMAPHGVSVTDHSFSTTDGSGFTIETMDGDNYLRRGNKQSYYVYEAYSSSTTVTCFNGPTGRRTTASGFYVIITCQNALYDCPLRYSMKATMNPAPPIINAAPSNTLFSVVLAVASSALALLLL